MGSVINSSILLIITLIYHSVITDINSRLDNLETQIEELK